MSEFGISEVDGVRRYSRRDVLRAAGLGLSGAAALALTTNAVMPARAFGKDGGGGGHGRGGGGGGGGDGGPPSAPPTTKPDIQYAIGPFTPPPISERGILFGLGGPTYTSLLTATFKRPLTRADQDTMNYILDTIDGAPNKVGGAYPFSPAGVFPIVSYGLPYFTKVSALAKANGKMDPVDQYMPFDTVTGNRALVEALPTPTDVWPGNTAVQRRFNQPLTIEANDVLFSFRSDSLDNLHDVENWIFKGSNSLNGQTVMSPDRSLMAQTSSRLLFVQIGLPRKMATNLHLPFANAIPVDSPMWFGIADQNVNGAGPAEITAFKGNSSAVRTTAKSGDYFDNATIQVLNHNISDLNSWYATAGSSEDFTRRLQLMFRPTHAFGNGGGSPFWDNQFFGTGDAEQGAAGIGTPGKVHRIGHLTALQRASRAPDGTPMHARMDGPGYSDMDVPPGNGPQPTLEFSAFCPTGDFFNDMRKKTAATDLAKKYAVSDADNGLESFINATRRQNFLSPPRRSRALPLVEFT